MKKYLYLLVITLLIGWAYCDEETVDADIGSHAEGSRTDEEATKREEEAIQLDGLSVAEMKALREKSEKRAFQAEVARMMKLIINSLYKNKEIFLRELISNASDALDKIRFLSVTDKSALSATDELSIRIRADKENGMLHIIDTGIGMTKTELDKNLGTIARSGTSEFLSQVSEGQMSDTDLIGQFGVGFYSSFLVADRVAVTSKNNDDEQHIWESNSMEYTIAKDPRGDTLKRGTQISLHMRDESEEFLEESKLKELVKKYSQFINFNIYLWTSKTVSETVDDEDKEAEEPEDKPATDETKDEDEDVVVEDEKEEEKKKKKTVDKTVWDWELMNSTKPIWMRKPAEISDDEYKEFYKSFAKDTENPLTYTHFTAEGEVTFKAIMYIPSRAPPDTYSDVPNMDNIKLYVRRVFIADHIEDLMPRYLSFIKGVVDSDDLPLNVSRETLQQNKLIKVIRKKIVRKVLDMIKKMEDDKMKDFWKEYGVKIKFGILEDNTNKNRLSKILRFHSSHNDTLTTLEQYKERMREKQEHIYFMGGTSKEEIRSSPFVERLLKRGYEVLYLTEPIDEYAVQALPDFEGKKFQNVAKEGLTFGEDSEKRKARKEAQETEFKPLMGWLSETGLKDKIEKAVISDRLDTSPCALVASQYGWSGNMERIMKAQGYHRAEDASASFYAKQKKTLEINPRHPIIKELLSRVSTNADDPTAKDIANTLFDTALLRSGYSLSDNVEFAMRIEKMLKSSLNIEENAQVEPDELDDEEPMEDSATAGEESRDENEESTAGEDDDTHAEL